MVTPNESTRPKGGGIEGKKNAMESRIAALEERLLRVEEEKEVMRKELCSLEEESVKTRGELNALRDSFEEAEWARRRLEEKVEEGRRKEEERETREKQEKEEMTKTLKDLEERLTKEKEKRADGEGEIRRKKKRKCVVIVDSNGRGASAESIKTHIPKEEQEGYEIEVKVAYTLEDLRAKMDHEGWDVKDAVTIVDTLTNNIRNTPSRPANSPHELVAELAKTRKKLYEAGAAQVVTCEIKPMTIVDVRPYNNTLHDYLCQQPDEGLGCRTQIRMSDLKGNGFHVLPECVTILDRTYACAIRGVPVPCPTPFDDLVPPFVRRNWEAEWPRLGGMGGRAPIKRYGW